MQLYETIMWLLPPSIIAENCWTNVLRIRKEAQEGGDRCIIMADLHCCMAETNATLVSNFPPIKKKRNIFLNIQECLSNLTCKIDPD